MLRKLIKYEFKATGRLLLPFFLSLLIFAVINKLISPANPESWGFPAAISMLIYIMIMVGMFVMTTIIMMQRFYRNLLSDEGYLMFTLPTKTWKLIVSKLVVSTFWIIASLTVAFFSILIIIYQKGVFMEGWRLLAEGFHAFAEGSHAFAEGFHAFYEMIGASLYTITLEIIIGSLITLVFGIVLVYASMAIGHLFNRHKILASFGAFIALNTLTQILFSLLCLTTPEIAWSAHELYLQNMPDLITLIQVFFLYGILFTGLLSAACFALTNHILSNKLNLE